MHQGDPIEGERPSTLAHGWSMMRAVTNDQHHKENINNIPEGPPDPPPPPDEPIQQQNKPLSIELEGERKLAVSSDNAHTSDEADMLGVSGSIKDARKRPKKLHNASVQVKEQPEQEEQENSPKQAPDKLGSDTAAPGKHQDHQGCPEGDGRQHNDAISMLC